MNKVDTLNKRRSIERQIKPREFSKIRGITAERQGMYAW